VVTAEAVPETPPTVSSSASALAVVTAEAEPLTEPTPRAEVVAVVDALAELATEPTPRALAVAVVDAVATPEAAPLPSAAAVAVVAAEAVQGSFPTPKADVVAVVEADAVPETGPTPRAAAVAVVAAEAVPLAAPTPFADAVAVVVALAVPLIVSLAESDARTRTRAVGPRTLVVVPDAVLVTTGAAELVPVLATPQKMKPPMSLPVLLVGSAISVNELQALTPVAVMPCAENCAPAPTSVGMHENARSASFAVMPGSVLHVTDQAAPVVLSVPPAMAYESVDLLESSGTMTAQLAWLASEETASVTLVPLSDPVSVCFLKRVTLLGPASAPNVPPPPL
jgi:hypothetical protein